MNLIYVSYIFAFKVLLLTQAHEQAHQTLNQIYYSQ